MRIIAGYARGILLELPSDGVRPTSDRVRVSWFAMFEPFLGKVVVDLFAGSGALGLEAVSRGARDVYMIEIERRHLPIIEGNKARVIKSAGQYRDPRDFQVQVICGNALAAPQLLATVRPDLIFADPPYHPPAGEVGGPEILADAKFAAWAGNAYLCLEQARVPFIDTDALEHWSLIKKKEFGKTVVYILQTKAAAATRTSEKAAREAAAEARRAAEEAVRLAALDAAAGVD